MSHRLSKFSAIAAIAFVTHLMPAMAGDDHAHNAEAISSSKQADDKGGGPAHTSRHGGQIVESGHHHLEVVARDGSLEVYVADSAGKPEDISGVKASAAILSGGKRIDVVLAPQGGALSGVGDFKTGKGTTIVVTLTMPGHETEQARVKLD